MSGEGAANQQHLKYAAKSLTHLSGSSLAGTVVPEDTTEVSYYASQTSLKHHGDKSFLKPKVRDVNRRKADDRDSLTRQKPTRELYRPPTINCGVAAANAMNMMNPLNPLNPSAKEFAPNQHSIEYTAKGPQDNIILNRTGLTITVPGKNNSIAKSRSVTSQLSTDRSGELAVAAGEQRVQRIQVDFNLFTFPLEVVNTLNKALEDPNRVPSRSLMELVKQILNKVISKSGLGPNGEPRQDISKLPEQASRLCIGIIEKEEKETFLESLINTCQELYHDRERLLRQDIQKWNSYISFLNQMYGLLKRKQLHFLRKYEGVAPKLVLLSLLAECCTATLTSSLLYISEIEILFVVLTHIGRDLENEMPGRMSLLITCLREAFLTPHLNKQIGKTLLQLIELRAAGWNLPAQAVMYYYPGSSA